MILLSVGLQDLALLVNVDILLVAIFCCHVFDLSVLSIFTLCFIYTQYIPLTASSKVISFLHVGLLQQQPYQIGYSK